jgi:hypothetical protein
MRNVDGAEVARLKSVQLDSMFDECTIDVCSESIDDHGDIIKTYTPSMGKSCGVQMLGGTETIRGQVVLATADAHIRLPLTENVTTLDRITVTKRNGVSVTPVQYSVKSAVMGTTCLIVDAVRMVL